MKVRVAAAAVMTLGVAAGAAAQSSVSIYGVIDQGVVKGNGGTATNVGANGTSRAWQVAQAASSRLGFRGVEDLGGGMSAQFNLETRFYPDTGVQRNANTFWIGNSYVQLNHRELGSVWMGRNYIPAFYVAVKLDPFTWDGIGQLGPQQFVLYKAKETVQTSNILGYKSPVMLGGLTFDPIVSLGEGTAARETGFNLQYSSGPLYVGMAYDRLNGGPAATKGDSLLTLGASYNFGVILPRVYLARSKTSAGTATSNEYVLAATAPVGQAGKIKAAFMNLNPAGVRNTQKKFSLGYEYAFSKQTNIYVDTSLGKEEGKTDNRAYMVGIKKLL